VFKGAAYEEVVGVGGRDGIAVVALTKGARRRCVMIPFARIFLEFMRAQPIDKIKYFPTLPPDDNQLLILSMAFLHPVGVFPIFIPILIHLFFSYELYSVFNTAN
jgi:hypothetical protein